MPTSTSIKSRLEDAACAARKSGDYLNYASFIDENLGDPTAFDTEEAAQALDTLADVLDSPGLECLVYHIGWDIPELLMLYVDHFNTGPEGYPDQAIVKALSKLGNVLCLKANPKEFFLKVCELMSASDTTFEDDDLDLDDKEAEFQANTRFCLLFEMMRFSLNRIKTPYPTRFIKTANSILLEVANSKTTITGVTTVLRRIFIFARDFDMDFTDVSEEEQAATRRLLVSLLTYGADVSLQQFNLKWTERFYYQLANKVSTSEDPAVRSSSYNLSLHTARLEDALSRCGQLALSYDMDPISAIMDFILADDPTPMRSYGCRPVGDEDSTLDYLQSPSLLGTMFLYTNLYFAAPPCQLNLAYSLRKARYLHKHAPMTAGMRDSMLYWALRNVTHVDPDQLREIPTEDISYHIRVLMDIAGESQVVNERCIAFCICGKILSRLDPEVGARIMLEAIKASQYPQILDAGVQILKSLLLGKRPNNRCLVNRFVDMVLQSPSISKELRLDIALTAEAAVNDIINGKSLLSPYIMSWINLLHVVETDPETVDRLRINFRNYLEKNTCGNSQLVMVALDSLGKPRSGGALSGFCAKSNCS